MCHLRCLQSANSGMLDIQTTHSFNYIKHDTVNNHKLSMKEWVLLGMKVDTDIRSSLSLEKLDKKRLFITRCTPKSLVWKKSWTKKVLGGLEKDLICDGQFKPVFCILSNDFEGIVFNVKDSQDFQISFEDIEKYFNGEDCNYMDCTINGRCWTFRFTNCYN